MMLAWWTTWEAVGMFAVGFLAGFIVSWFTGKKE